MNPINQKAYYVEENGWFTSSLKPVTRKAFKKHQSEKRATPSSLNRAIQALAMGILAVTQSMRVSMHCSASGAQVALSALSLHLWSQIPTASAQATVLIPTATTTGPPGPQGEEFQVNTYTPRSQANPSVAALTQGGFVVTWESYEQDGANDGVYGQRFDRAGAKVGSEFPINTYTEHSQEDPSVAALAGGGFVVTWTSHRQDRSNAGVYGQRFDGAGAKAGSEFQVNTYTKDFQEDPSVAGLAGGGFVVTWSSSGQDGSINGVYGQRFDRAGAKMGNEFPINTYDTRIWVEPSIATLAGGGFVVTWDSFGQAVSGKEVYGQRFDAAGAKVGSEFPINTNTTNSQAHPSVAALAGEGFVVTWQSNGQDGDGYGIYGQQFDGAGAKVGSEFQINTYTSNTQQAPSVASRDGGGFVVTWQSQDQDGSDYGVYGQRFDEAGAKVGSEFQINTYTTNSQSNPSVAALAEGGFVVTWDSYGQDGSSPGIFGRLFPGNSSSTVSPATFNKSSAGSTTITSQTKNSESSQAQKNKTELPRPSGVTEPVSSTTGPSTRHLSVQASEAETDRARSSDQATSQTPLIAGVAAGVAALAYSLLAGGLFYWRRKKAGGEPNRAVQLESGNGNYQVLSGVRSHYKEWPQQVPSHDKSHYHPDIEKLNQKMAQEYGDLSSPQGQGDYDIIATSHYRDLPQEAPSHDKSHYHPDIEVLNQDMAKEYGDVSSPQQKDDYDIIATSDYRDLPKDALKEMDSARV